MESLTPSALQRLGCLTVCALQMERARQRLQEAVEGRRQAAEAVTKLQAQLSSLSKQRDAALADNQHLQGRVCLNDMLGLFGGDS